ncbi:MAG TPA: PKD domain-containing protein, partial [Puia sp.]|nr:PKD domain-containing protein [Puia sp.]
MIRKLLFSLVTGLLTTFIVYGQAPVASFTTTSATQGCGPLIVNFQSTSTPAGVTLNWNFGGNPPDVSIPSSNSPTPVVVFNTPGTYNVTLTATNVNGSSTSAPMVIRVYPSPVADFNTTDTLGCSPYVVHLFDNSSAGAGATIASRTWYFPGGDTSILANPVYTFTLPGNYAVNLQVVNNFGCKGSASLKTKTGYINVTPGVIANFDDSLSHSCNPPTTAFFLNQTTGPGTITYSWNFGDGGSSNAANPNHIYA